MFLKLFFLYSRNLDNFANCGISEDFLSNTSSNRQKKYTKVFFALRALQFWEMALVFLLLLREIWL